MLISICICTFKRPQLLAQLLAALTRQTVLASGATLQIVVVDNDPAHSARELLAQWPAPPGCSLQFFHAPQPNISVARNTAVAAARGEWLVFVDDDETPVDDWLAGLLAAQARYQADAVFGPVLPRYLPGTPAWIIAGRYFERARYPTGTTVPIGHARTGNVLLRASSLAWAQGQPFERSFGTTGGEDSLFFRAMLARGARFIWCDEASVSEEVPLARARAAWLFSRSYRVGQTWIRGELFAFQGLQRGLRGLVLGARAFLQFWLSLLLALLCLLYSRHKAFYWLRTATTQAGKITGMTRLRYQEYGA